MLAELAPGSAVAGVFTRSRCSSAPVEWCRKRISGGRVRAIVVNAGNANAFTGLAGEKAVVKTANTIADLLDCQTKEVFLASTGVIGEVLPVQRIERALPTLVGKLRSSHWKRAANAILTTDTYPKGASISARIGGTSVNIAAFAKGSGMIAPDMATMLAFLFTDAKIPPAVLKKLLVSSSERSFNSITVDSDTSTNDSVFLCATGKGKPHKAVRSASDPHLRDFKQALEAVMVDLAQQIVRDGEGASKFVTIIVKGAASEKAARAIGLSIANSPLVKTAIAGQDSNWGRIVMAVGKASERVNQKKLDVRIGGIQVAKGGAHVHGYKEESVAKHMKGRAIDIAVDVGVGRGCATVWTCDLTHGYIKINADYRT